MKIDKDNRVATFKNLDSGDLSDVDFDFLHFSPPQTAPAFVRESSLAAGNGWLDVNTQTLQHNKYSNVFGVGDVCNLPTAKTAAGVFSQAPIVTNNLLVEMGINANKGYYNGYNSCPVFVGGGKLMMVEFAYTNPDTSDETFWADQTKPNRMFYYMKKYAFPAVYWNMMPKGNWYGRNIFPKSY